MRGTPRDLLHLEAEASSQVTPVIVLADAACVAVTILLDVSLLASGGGLLRLVLALAFITAVPGWGVVRAAGLATHPTGALLSLPVSLAICAAASTGMVWLGAWHPVALFSAMAMSSLALLAWAFRLPSTWLVMDAVRARWRPAATDLLLPVAAALWIAGARHVNVRAIGDFGLVPALPAAYFLGLLVLIAYFAIALARSSGWRLAVTAVAFLVMLQGLMPVALPMPQYAYVFKHIGVTEYISLHGSVNGSIDIYQNWPGFFALAAWFDSLAGLATPVSYAAWAPVYFDLMAVIAINGSLRALAIPIRTRWLALVIFVAGNWVGQDYFAPQAFAFALSQAVIACLLTWFSGPVAPWLRKLEEWMLGRLRTTAARASSTAVAAVSQSRPPAVLAIVMGMFAVVTFSHQLSPYMVIVSSAVLAVPKLLRPRWIVAVLVLIAGSYLLLRLDFLRSHGDLLLSFDPFRNANNPEATPNQGVLGRVVTGYAARGLSALVWLIAVAGFIRSIRMGNPALALLALMLAPALIIFGQEYGGEAIYRVYLFSLPWAACLAAIALAPRVGWTWWAGLRTGLALGVLTALFLQAYFGLAEINQVTPAEVAASEYFYQHAQRGSVLVLAAPNYPERDSARYDQFVVTSGAFDPKLVPNKRYEHRMLGAADLPDVEATVRSYAPHGYIAITTGMKIYAHVFTLLPDGSLDHLDAALAASPRWHVFYRNSDVVIYQLVGAPPAKKT